MPPLYMILLGLLLFCSLHTPLCSSATANANDTLAAGQALAAAGDKLVSRNGKFALGFFQPCFFQPAASITSKSHNTVSPNSSWYLGIWFNKIPVFTTVWVANRDEPIPDSKLNLTQLKISSHGNLVLVVAHAGTESLVWSTPFANRTQTSINATSAVLLNSGNFALVETPSSKVLLWQSFDYPADVVLSGSKFGRNKLTGLNRQLISKKSRIDPGLGSYSIGVGTSGMVLQRSNPSIVYWSWASGTSTSKLIPILNSILGYDPRTKGLFYLTYVDNNVEEYYMYTLPDDTYSVFASLDISGRVELNIWSQPKQSWTNLYTEPVDPCSPPAACGPFTLCNNRATPSCDCMESFSQKSPHDWEFDDRTGGCIRDTPLHCTGSGNTTSSTDMFHPIANVQLPISPQSIDLATTQSKCEEACLNSCSCTAYSYNNSRCSVWHGELFSVNLNDGVGVTSEDALYLRLAAKDLLNRGEQSLPDAKQVQRRVGIRPSALAGQRWAAVGHLNRSTELRIPGRQAGRGNGAAIRASRHLDEAIAPSSPRRLVNGRTSPEQEQEEGDEGAVAERTEESSELHAPPPHHRTHASRVEDE